MLMKASSQSLTEQLAGRFAGLLQRRAAIRAGAGTPLDRSIVLFGSAFAVGYARVNEGRVLPGVDVGGVEGVPAGGQADDERKTSTLSTAMMTNRIHAIADA